MEAQHIPYAGKCCGEEIFASNEHIYLLLLLKGKDRGLSLYSCASSMEILFPASSGNARMRQLSLAFFQPG